MQIIAQDFAGFFGQIVESNSRFALKLHPEPWLFVWFHYYCKWFVWSSITGCQNTVEVVIIVGIQLWSKVYTPWWNFLCFCLGILQRLRAMIQKPVCHSWLVVVKSYLASKVCVFSFQITLATEITWGKKPAKVCKLADLYTNFFYVEFFIYKHNVLPK